MKTDYLISFIDELKFNFDNCESTETHLNQRTVLENIESSFTIKEYDYLVRVCETIDMLAKYNNLSIAENSAIKVLESSTNSIDTEAIVAYLKKFNLFSMNIKEVNKEHYIISDVINNKRVEMDYMYYSRDEAITLFKEKYEDDYALQNESILDGDFD